MGVAGHEDVESPLDIGAGLLPGEAEALVSGPRWLFGGPAGNGGGSEGAKTTKIKGLNGLEFVVRNTLRCSDDKVVDIASMASLEGPELGLGHPPRFFALGIELGCRVVLSDRGLVAAVSDGAVEVDRKIDPFDPFGGGASKRLRRPTPISQMGAQKLPGPVTIDDETDGEDRIRAIRRDRAINDRW